MGLAEIVYSPLKEEKQLTGWSKETIDYIIRNKAKIETSIRGIAKSQNILLQRTDIDDIYMEVLNYLYNSDDYNITKAYERSNNTGAIVSLDGYVHSCVKFCVKRFLSEKFKREKNTVREHIKDDNTGQDVSLFDMIPDDKDYDMTDGLECPLDEICKSFESERYQFGPDIFQIWFVRLQTILSDKNDRYKDILDILGVSNRDISEIEKEISTDGAMISIAKAITRVGVEDAIGILKKYTYSADKLKKIIDLF